jgi:hypothetical protein
MSWATITKTKSSIINITLSADEALIEAARAQAK